MSHLCSGGVFAPHAACKQQPRQVQRADCALASNCQGNIAMPGGQAHLVPPSHPLPSICMKILELWGMDWSRMRERARQGCFCVLSWSTDWSLTPTWPMLEGHNCSPKANSAEWLEWVWKQLLCHYPRDRRCKKWWSTFKKKPPPWRNSHTANGMHSSQW